MLNYIYATKLLNYICKVLTFYFQGIWDDQLHRKLHRKVSPPKRVINRLALKICSPCIFFAKNLTRNTFFLCGKWLFTACNMKRCKTTSMRAKCTGSAELPAERLAAKFKPPGNRHHKNSRFRIIL